MLCKNCKFFKRSDEGISHKCLSPKFIYSSGVVEDDQLAYMDYEDYAAVFAVGENFGCIHFSELKA